MSGRKIEKHATNSTDDQSLRDCLCDVTAHIRRDTLQLASGPDTSGVYTVGHIHPSASLVALAIILHVTSVNPRHCALQMNATLCTMTVNVI